MEYLKTQAFTDNDQECPSDLDSDGCPSEVT